MSSKKDFKIVIVGGGVAGLTLANMLEKFDIDYILLEGHSAIAPPVGASIGLFPNGLRILDQVGCYEPLEAMSLGATKDAHTRDGRGKVIATMQDMSGHLIKRHGYPLLFFNRQWLLQVLYDQLTHKQNIYLNSKVNSINHVDHGVEVTCRDGRKFGGSLIVGADGIHSTVRKEMFRIGNELSPGYFTEGEDESVPCYYKCSFGIAQNVPNWVAGEQNIVVGTGLSQLVVSGPENRVYWFVFVRLPEVKHGKEIPKYSKEDEAEFVKDFSDLAITETVTFGQVFAHRLVSTLTPLHEVVFKKWFFKRIIIFGDSAHKPNPIGGQGGNGAIESAAEFVNAILDKRDSRAAGLSDLQDEDITDIFMQTQKARDARARQIVDRAHQQQALNAYENPLVSTLVWGVAARLSGDESTLSLIGGVLVGGTSLKKLPVPRRPRAIPFTDELPQQPVSNKKALWVKVAFIAGMGLLFMVAKNRRFSSSNIGRWVITGPMGEINATDKLVSATANVSTNTYPTSKLYSYYSLSQLISPLLLYTIEGYRVGNQGSILSLPSLFTVGIQFFGIDCVAPLYAVLSTIQGFNLPTGRYVPLEVAKSLLPSLILGYLIPSMLMLSPTNGSGGWQGRTTLWRLAPPLFFSLTLGFSVFLNRLRRRNTSKTEQENEKPYFDRYGSKDASLINYSYGFAFLLQAAAHIGFSAYADLQPNGAVREFFQIARSSLLNWHLPNVTPWVVKLIKDNLAIPTAAMVMSNLYTIWDFRRVGYITGQDALKAGFAVIVGQPLVGTSATWVGLWYWREKILLALSR